MPDDLGGVTNPLKLDNNCKDVAEAALKRWQDAVNMVRLSNPDNEIIAIAETEDLFVIALDTDGETYKTVNKNTGEENFMWVWDYAALSKAGKAIKLDLTSLLQKAS